MQALTLNGYGSNEKLSLRQMAKPAPQANEILIKVAYAGLNPVDYKTRNGALKALLPLQFPQIAGNEVAGAVEQTGDEVSGFQPGQHVCVRLDKTRMGGFAEYVCCDENLACPAPHNVDLSVAAGIPLVGLTAYQILNDYAQIRRGQRVLIHAGAGAVGRIAIQLAKLVGAYVATTVSERGIPIVEALGADKIINYRATRFEQAVKDIDLVIDTVGGDTLNRSFTVVKPGGKVCSISALPEPRTAGDINAGWKLKSLFWLISGKLRRLAKKHQADYRFLLMHANGEQLNILCRLCESGQLKFDIDRIFTLEDYAQAYNYQEQGKAFGKVILSVE